jgi:antitoxin (DNA-binding transcriptional repressor) of toxin-antitoxin stability system
MGRKAMQTETVDVNDAQKRLIELLSRVREGAEIILAEDDKPLARLVPITSTAKPRTPGLHQGTIWTSDDFDEPLPDEFWAGAL